MDLSRRAILTRFAGGVMLLGGGVAVWQRRELGARLTNLRAIFTQSEYLDGLETPEDLLTYIEEHRSDIALVSYAAASDGSIDPAETDFSLGANRAMPLASTIKIVVLAAYARAVVADGLDPDTPVSVAEWERYYVPGTDGGAHAEALTALDLTTDDNGWASQRTQTVPLHEIVRAMIRFSDNAATDYLRTRLGAPALESVTEDGNLRNQEPVHSFVGEVLLWANHDAPRLTDARLNELLALSRKEYLAEVASYENRYLDTEWGNEERQWRNEHAPTPNLPNQRIAANELSAKGTAGEYARMMAGVVTGTFLSPAVSELMREYLEWPTEVVLVFDVNLGEQRQVLPVGIGLGLGGDLSTPPAVAENRADGVLSCTKGVRDVVRLVLETLVVARPTGWEHRVAHAVAVHGQFVHSAGGGVRASGPNIPVRSLERRTRTIRCLTVRRLRVEVLFREQQPRHRLAVTWKNGVGIQRLVPWTLQANERDEPP